MLRRPACRSLAAATLAALALATGCAAPRTAPTTATLPAIPPAPKTEAFEGWIPPVAQESAEAGGGAAGTDDGGRPLEVRVIVGARSLDEDLDPVDEPVVFGADLGYTPQGWGNFTIDLGILYAIDAEDEVFPGAYDLSLATAELYAGPRYTLRADGLFGGALQPYVGGGVSLVAVHAESVFGADFEDGTAGLYGIVGLRWAFDNVALGAEYRVLGGTKFEDSDGPVSIDTDVDYDQIALVIAIFL